MSWPDCLKQDNIWLLNQIQHVNVQDHAQKTQEDLGLWYQKQPELGQPGPGVEWPAILSQEDFNWLACDHEQGQAETRISEDTAEMLEKWLFFEIGDSLNMDDLGQDWIDDSSIEVIDYEDEQVQDITEENERGFWLI